jgi:hypothetical protein
MQQFRGAVVCLALWAVSAAAIRAGDNTLVNEDDVKALTPLDGHERGLQSWRDGIAFRVARGPWLTASWNRPEAQPLLPLTEVKVMDICRNKAGHFVCVQGAAQTLVLQLKGEDRETVKVPEALSESAGVRFIPCNTGLALGFGETVWWQKEGGWHTTQATPCPSMLKGSHNMPVDPLGDVNFIKNGFLYSGSEGGEFGGAFAWYDLSQERGSWGLIWRGSSTISVAHLFQDSAGTLWAFAHLNHLGGYQYSLNRGLVSRWETVIANSLSSARAFEPRDLQDFLQKDSLVADAAPMPDGQIALLAEDEGLYLKGNGKCSCLFHFKFHHWNEPPCLCFDDSGNAYVATGSQGLLIFHKEASGPWRVKQIKSP